MNDIFNSWLSTQASEAAELSANSDIVNIVPLSMPVPKIASWLNRDMTQNSTSSSTADSTNADKEEARPPSRFLVNFRCNGFVLPPGALRPQFVKDGVFRIGVYFPSDYLRQANFMKVLTLLMPFNFFHPNARRPHLCVGRMAPGAGLVDIVYQLYEMISMARATIREDDSLNPAACQWFRTHWDGKPVDTRPLRRRELDLHVEKLAKD